LFFYQTIQKSLSLYYSVPVRILRPINCEELFQYCKKNRLFGFTYSDKISWFKDIKELLDSIPSFLSDEKKPTSFNHKRFHDIRNFHFKRLYELAFMTESSNHSFFYKTIKLNTSVRCMTILHAIFISLSFALNKKLPKNLKFLDLSFKIAEVDSMLIMLGPVDLRGNFQNEEIKIEYIKRLKNYFLIKQHTYDLINLLNQRESIELNDFEKKTNRLISSFKYSSCFDSNKEYAKKTLRELAAYCIDLNQNGRKKNRDINEKSFDEYRKNRQYITVSSQIKNSKIARDFESIELFSNLSFKHEDFDKFTSDALDFLSTKLQADTYVFNRYYQYNKTYKLQAQKNLNPKYKSNIENILKKINAGEKLKESTISYQMVNGYEQNRKPINLISDFDKSNIMQMFDNQPKVNSSLSIPLIFDDRIFAVIHFLGYSKYQFDDMDQKFLLKHASIISRRYIENIFDENLAHITKLLEGFESKISNQKSLSIKIHQICEDITKIFSCDGVALWINKKEVYHTSIELDEATLEAEINFLEKGEEDRYPFDTKDNKYLFCSHTDKDILAINNIKNDCNLGQDNCFCMLYKDKFVQKGITSLVATPIKNYQGKLTGTLVIFDKKSRDYDELTKSMMKRVSLHLGAILNTISTVRYQTQQIDERSLHESAQYLNMIDSRTKDLESRLKGVFIPHKHERQSVFLNIEDIKDYTTYTRNFLRNLFQHGKFTKRYDKLIQEDIKNIKSCKDFTCLKHIINQILSSNKKRMNQEMDIIYNNTLQSRTLIKLPKQEFHNVIYNIINNAIKYGKKGTYIKLSEEKNNHYYNLYIENIGYKIYSHERDRIFLKGYRGSVTKEELKDKKEFQESQSQNKGIGLYYAMSVSKAWGGNIKLEKSDPIGNTDFAKNIFIIKIPSNIIKEQR